MDVLELKMSTDLATAIPAEIGFNFEELKSELTQRLKHYNSLVVTEDAIKDAKDDRANLRKLSTALNERQKEVVDQWNLPLTTFKNQVKELKDLIEKPVASIDIQIKKFEEQEREAKRKEIEVAYAELVPEERREIIPLDRIMDKKWLNKGTSMKSIREDIANIDRRTYVDISFIDAAADPQYITAVRAKYIETLDVNKAMDHQAELKAAEERFRAQEAARAERAAQAAARASQIPQAEEKPPVVVQEPVREPAPAPQPRADEKRYLLRLEFPAITQPQATALKQFLEQNNIQFAKIK